MSAPAFSHTVTSRVLLAVTTAKSKASFQRGVFSFLATLLVCRGNGGDEGDMLDAY